MFYIIDCLRLYLDKYLLSPFLIYVKSLYSKKIYCWTVVTDIFHKLWNAQNLGHMKQGFNNTHLYNTTVKEEYG